MKCLLNMVDNNLNNFCSFSLSISAGRWQWRTQEFCLGGGSTKSVEDRENGDLGVVAPSQGFWRQL